MSTYKRKGYNPKSLDNLKRMSDRSTAERKALARKGGLESARKYKERHPRCIIIDKGCPLCKGTIRIKYDTRQALIDALLYLIDAYEPENQPR